jgi:hypothetical protein
LNQPPNRLVATLFEEIQKKIVPACFHFAHKNRSEGNSVFESHVISASNWRNQMKKAIFTVLTTILLLVQMPQQSAAQFDLGNVLRGGVQRGAQQIQGEIRGAVRGVVQDLRHGGPQHQILPYPPPHLVQPQPIRPQPMPPGVIRPIEPPICSTPIVTYPVINNPIQTQVVPQSASRPQTQTTQPAKPETETRLENLPTVFGGQEVAIDGEGFGVQGGSVRIKIGPMILLAKTTTWSDTSVEAVIPEMPLLEPAEALIAVINAEKQVVQQFAILLTPSPDESASNHQATAPQLPTVQMGTELELSGNELGSEPGKVELLIGDSKLAATVVRWTDDEVTIRIPDLPLAESMQGTIQLILADGNPVSEVPVIFTK